MKRRFSILLAIASLAGLAISPSPSAAGGLIAPTSVCPGQIALGAPAAAQEATMLCMTEFARAEAGLAALATTPELEQSAGDKGSDILRCDSFSHYACGREFTYWMRQTGYTSAPCWRVGENLAWGSGEYGTARSIFRAWMASPEHRANILGAYSEVGVNVQVGTLGGVERTRVWTEHLGHRCE